MPYYYRRRRRPRRRFYYRRPRTTFWWRRRRWRKRRPVRRKLKKIILKQYQPDTIKKCTIRGLHALVIGNKKRLNNNYRQYEQSITPEFLPGGGGFSITKYTLDALFEEHRLVRNWWTSTNQNLPLVRYNGCKFKLYRAEDVDYAVVHFNCFPMTATNDLYTSCHPVIQLMNHSRTIVPSKKTQPKGKAYKTIRVPPPAQMLNRWYFTKDIATTGLVMLTVTAVSLDHYYISPYSESNNMTFLSLNPTFFRRHNFQQPGPRGYLPLVEGTNEKRMWALTNGAHQITQVKIKDIIFLGNTMDYQPGFKIGEVNVGDWNNKWNDYFKNKTYWGNPFYTGHLQNESRIMVSTKSLDALKTQYPTGETHLKDSDFTLITQHELVECRYAPDRDRGDKTQIYLKSNIRDESEWEAPTNKKLEINGFPLWLAGFGWLDWQRKQQEALLLERDWLYIIVSDKIQPPMPYYIPIDYDFYRGQSPYRKENEITPSDRTHWYPQVGFQHQTLEDIIQTGPGIAKLSGNKKSFEIKTKYSFYWKFGGCPPKMDKVYNPTEMPIYPVPNNDFQTNSLQNPNIPPEYFLYKFDTRKDQITEKASKRIKTDWETTMSLFTDGSRMDPPAQETAQTDDSSSTDSETEKEEQTLLLKLHKQRRKRRRLQHKLLQLMQQT